MTRVGDHRQMLINAAKLSASGRSEMPVLLPAEEMAEAFRRCRSRGRLLKIVEHNFIYVDEAVLRVNNRG